MSQRDWNNLPDNTYTFTAGPGWHFSLHNGVVTLAHGGGNASASAASNFIITPDPGTGTGGPGK